MNPTEPSRFDRLSTLAPHYDVAFCDLWGVLHNGREAFPEACDALAQFRAFGGRVILITNAPRPNDVIVDFLNQLSVPPDCYDAVISSGDLAREYVAARRGEAIFWIGPEKDEGIYAGLNLTFAPLASATYVVCSGLRDDETESASDYRQLLHDIHRQRLPMLCGNPDTVVMRGDRKVPCAGAIAELYREIGGEVIYTGKPHRPIYEKALELARQLCGRDVPLPRILAIGDSLPTDIAGATGFGLDCLFVSAGVHHEELSKSENYDAALADLLAKANITPKAITHQLVW